jgi:hypothetical protein
MVASSENVFTRREREDRCGLRRPDNISKMTPTAQLRIVFHAVASLRLHNAMGAILMCWNVNISLEAEAKGNLHRARAADLEEWTQLAQDVAMPCNLLCGVLSDWALVRRSANRSLKCPASNLIDLFFHGAW